MISEEGIKSIKEKVKKLDVALEIRDLRAQLAWLRFVCRIGFGIIVILLLSLLFLALFSDAT